MALTTSMWTMGRNYLSGHDGELILDGMPVRSAVQVQTVGKSHPWQYVADSANTATSLATGVNTQMGRVGTGPDDEDLITLAERASAAGFKTGIVSSSSITDATPAAFMAHVSSRGCENPEIILGGEMYGNEFEGCPQDAKANGGPGSIAEQIVASTVDVALGGGLKHFQTPDPATGATVLDSVDAETDGGHRPRSLGCLLIRHCGYWVCLPGSFTGSLQALTVA